jgi:hypothetical protein
MKKIEIFGERIPWSFIGVLFALAFGIFGIYSWLHERKPNISFEITSETNVLDVRKPLEDLSIFFQKEDIQKENLNLRIFTIRVENNGEVDILQGQYDANDIWGIHVQDARIIEARLINSNSEYLRTKLEPNLIEGNKLKLKKVIFEKGKFFVLELLVLHEKFLQPEIVPIGKIAGIDRIMPIKSWAEEEKQSFLTKILYGNVFIHLIRFIGYFLILIIAGFATGIIVMNFSGLIGKRRIKLRKREIIRVFGDRALTENKEEKFVYEFYINYGEKRIKSFSELLKKENKLLSEIKRYELIKKLNEVNDLTPSELIPTTSSHERERASRSIIMKSPIAKLVENGIVALGSYNKVKIKKEFKRTLDDFIKYLEGARK